VAGADDGSRLLDHLQDGSPVDIPCDVGVVRAHDPARGRTRELAPPRRAPSPGPQQHHCRPPGELPGHLPTPMPATSPALPARGFLRGVVETTPNYRWEWKRASPLCWGGWDRIALPPHCGRQRPSRAHATASQLLLEQQITDRRREGEARRPWSWALAQRGAVLRQGSHAGGPQRAKGCALPAHTHHKGTVLLRRAWCRQRHRRRQRCQCRQRCRQHGRQTAVHLLDHRGISL